MAGGGKNKSKPIPNEGLRQRKPTNGDGSSQRNEKPEKVSAPKQVSTPKQHGAAPVPSSGGMTCLNWFLVLVLILLSSGGTFFFIHNEITMTRKLLQKELLELRKDAAETSDLKTQIQDLTTKLGAVKQLQEDVNIVKENDNTRTAQFKQFSSDIEKSQQSTADLSTHFDNTIKILYSMKKDTEALREKVMKPQNDEEMKAEVKKIHDLFAVADTNAKYLSDEIIRIGARLNTNSDQTSSVQQEVINLTADKVQMSAAIESIKSTVVGIRDKVHNLPQEAANTEGGSGSLDEKLQKLDTKMSAEIERLSRQISETSENSAQWLQESSNTLTQDYKASIEDLKKQFNDLKVVAQEPKEASENESLVNSVAAFDSRLNKLEETQERNLILFLDFKEKFENQEKDDDKDYESLRDGMIKLTSQVISLKSIEDGMEDLTKTVTTLSNDLNSQKSISRILESRLDEIREKKEKPEEEGKSSTK